MSLPFQLVFPGSTLKFIQSVIFVKKTFISLAIGILGNKTFVLEVPQHSVVQQKPKFISSTFNKGQCEQVLVKL